VGDRTFNLDVQALRDQDSLQGIINGDKNGLLEHAEPEPQPEPEPYP